MTTKELKKLSRAELLEMLLMQTKRVEELEAQLEDVKKQLEDKNIIIEKAGSVAEAALQLNGVFEAAQNAADQYLDNIRDLWNKTEETCAKKEAESEELLKKSKELLAGTEAKQEE